MNQLILNNLPIPVLLVWGLPEDAETPFISPYEDGILGYWRYNGHLAVKAKIPKGNWQLIGKLSELTEGRARLLVHIPEQVNYRCYKLFRGQFHNVEETALESFHSSIEAEGYFVVNPNSKTHFNPEEYIQEEYERFMDAQSKTLPANTLIFKK